MSSIEHSKSLFIAYRALIASVLRPIHGTLTTEIMAANRHHGIRKILAANKAGEWQVLLIAVNGIFIVIIVIAFIWFPFLVIPKACNTICYFLLLLSLFIIPFSLELPPALIVSSIVQKLTTVTETTKSSLFIIFAYVRLCCSVIRCKLNVYSWVIELSESDEPIIEKHEITW